MSEYNNDATFKSNWDSMQRKLKWLWNIGFERSCSLSHSRCCGGRHYEVGFNDWNQIMAGDVPDSCCNEEFEDCGKGKITYSQE